MHHYFYKLLHYGSLRWANLPSMTAERADCGMLCYPPNGSLIAVGGRSRRYNRRRNWDALDAHISSVEVLRSGNCDQWQKIQSIPLVRGRPGVEYFRGRVFVFVGADSRAFSSGFLLMSSPLGTDIIEQWIILSPRGPRVLGPTVLTACNGQLFSIGKSQLSDRNNSYTRNLY